MKKLNKKGFTLIELLAVIVILGVLMLVAIPAVTRYINTSREKTFRNTAHQLIDGVRNYVVIEAKSSCYADIQDIDLEKGDKSKLTGYIHATKDTTTGTFTYEIVMYDSDKKMSLGTTSSLVSETSIDTQALGNTAVTSSNVSSAVIKTGASANSCY